MQIRPFAGAVVEPALRPDVAQGESTLGSGGVERRQLVAGDEDQPTRMRDEKLSAGAGIDQREVGAREEPQTRLGVTDRGEPTVDGIR